MCCFKGLTLRKFVFDVCVYMCVLCLGKEWFCGLTGEKGAYVYIWEVLKCGFAYDRV